MEREKPKTKVTEDEPKSQPEERKTGSSFGYFEKMKSSRNRYPQKPQRSMPRGGRNGQGKPT